MYVPSVQFMLKRLIHFIPVRYESSELYTQIQSASSKAVLALYAFRYFRYIFTAEEMLNFPSLQHYGNLHFVQRSC